MVSFSPARWMLAEAETVRGALKLTETCLREEPSAPQTLYLL
jgi:hypothetical protein